MGVSVLTVLPTPFRLDAPLRTCVVTGGVYVCEICGCPGTLCPSPLPPHTLSLLLLKNLHRPHPGPVLLCVAGGSTTRTCGSWGTPEVVVHSVDDWIP